MSDIQIVNPEQKSAYDSPWPVSQRFLRVLWEFCWTVFCVWTPKPLNEWRLFWHVTLPRLRPILLVLVVLRFGTAMAVIDEYLILGGFNRALPTYTWTVYMWDEAFQIGDWFQGYAAAIGWIGAAAMLVVVAGLFWAFRNRDG